MIIYWFIGRDGVKHGCLNSYKVDCMGVQNYAVEFGNSKVTDVSEFDGMYHDIEWLG